MENSSPEIHTIPSGNDAGGAVVLGMVGPNPVIAGAAVGGSGCSVSNLLAGERRDGCNRANAIAETTAGTIRIHTERLSVEIVVAVGTLIWCFRFTSALVSWEVIDTFSNALETGDQK